MKRLLLTITTLTLAFSAPVGASTKPTAGCTLADCVASNCPGGPDTCPRNGSCGTYLADE
jgi:hypothetical protein